MKAYKHKGKHITVNTVSELEEAKNQINKFIMKRQILKNKNVLITGVSGFVGSNLAKNLLENGANVTGITQKKEEETLYCIMKKLIKSNFW